MDKLDQESLDIVKTWLSNRHGPSDDIDHYYQTNVLIQPGDDLRSIGFPDIHLSRYNSPKLKRMPPIEIHQLLKWMMKFLTSLRDNKGPLETIELIRTGFNGRLATFHVQEAIDIVQGALCCDVVSHELDAAGGGCANEAEFVLVDELSGAIHDVLLRVCVCLFSQRPVRLIAKASNYNSSLGAAYLVDLMHAAGASCEHVRLLAQDLRRSEAMLQGTLSWRLSPAARKQDKLSCVAVCFADADLSLAIQSILESYLRQLAHSPNLIILVEENIYEHFLADWHRNYLRLMAAAADGVQVDLNSIDMSLAHRMAGRCINVIRFRSVEELRKLMNKLRKIPHTQVWSRQYSMARQFCLAGASASSQQPLNNCAQFWLNHLPATPVARKFADALIRFKRDSLRQHMDNVYSDVWPSYEEDIERLLKQQAGFVRKRGSHLRCRQVLCAYLSLIHRFRSMKPASLTENESLIRMKKFHSLCSIGVSELANESRIETHLMPVGLAVLKVRDKRCVKSKSVLIDFVFKNLLLGNAVLLVCPQTLLGARFPLSIMSQYNLPFELRHPKEIIFFDNNNNNNGNEEANLSDRSHSSSSSMSSSSWDSSSEDGLNLGELPATPNQRTQLNCPAGVYAVEFAPGGEVDGERVNELVMALGAKRKSIWYPDALTHLLQTLVAHDEEQQQQQVEVDSCRSSGRP